MHIPPICYIYVERALSILGTTPDTSAHICMKGKTTDATEIGDALCALWENSNWFSASISHAWRQVARRQRPRADRQRTHKQFHPFYRENDFNQTHTETPRIYARILCCILPAARAYSNDSRTTHKRDRQTQRERSAYRAKCKCAQRTYLRLHAFYFIKKVLCARRGCIKGLWVFLCERERKKGWGRCTRWPLFVKPPHQVAASRTQYTYECSAKNEIRLFYIHFFVYIPMPHLIYKHGQRMEISFLYSSAGGSRENQIINKNGRDALWHKFFGNIGSNINNFWSKNQYQMYRK